MIKNIIWEIKRQKKYKNIIILVFLIFIFLSFVLLYFSSKLNFSYSKEVFYLPKQEIYVDDNFEGKLYFNDEINGSKFKDLILSSIKDAQQTIDVSVYSININEIAQALSTAQKRGIEVNIVLDKSKKRQHNIVFDESLDLDTLEIGSGYGRDQTYMHHKFVLFDKDTENAKLLFGSFNYTYLQEKYDPSFILETRNKDIINSFREENSLMLEDIRGYQKIQTDNYKPFAKKINYNNGFVEVWFSPGFKKNSIKQRMLDLIESSQKNIDILIWRLTDDDLVKKLIEKAREGVQVRIITDDYYIWSNNSALQRIVRNLSNSSVDNIEIISDLYRTLNFKNIAYSNKNYFNPYLHQHALIIDNNIVLSGTNNWSYNGFFRNDESIIISDVPFWVNSFNSAFDYQYKKLRNQNLNLEIEENKITILNNDNFIGAKLLIYNEFSGIDKIPSKCFDILIDRKGFSFDLPLECNQEHSLIFILDKNQEVMASTYLNF